MLLKKYWLVFVHSWKLSTVYLLLVGATIWFLSSNLYYAAYYDLIGNVQNMLRPCIVGIAVFIYLGYEFGVKVFERNLDESITALNSRGKTLTSTVSVLALLAGGLFLIHLGFFAVLYLKEDTYSLLLGTHVALCGVLYVFVPLFASGLIGALFAVALKTRRFLVYMLTILFILLNSDMIVPVLFLPYNYFHSTQGTSFLYRVKDFFTLVPFNLVVNAEPDSAYGIPMELARWAVAAFWVAIPMGCMAVWANRGRRRHRKQNLMLSLVAAVAVLSVACLAIDHTDARWDWRPSGAKVGDGMYYSTQKPALGQPADFSIRRYDMELSFFRGLHAKVKVTLEERTEEENYNFTLYHQYKVKRILLDDGTPVQFTQEGDCVSIPTKEIGSSPTLTFEYAGYSPWYYSNLQGIRLPGYFPYYPMEGKQAVWNEVSNSYVCIRESTSKDFNVRIDSLIPVYSNLSRDGGSFSGHSEGLSLFGGLLNEGENVIKPISFPSMLLEDIAPANLEAVDKKLAKTEAVFGNQVAFPTLANKPVFITSGVTDVLAVLNDHVITSRPFPDILYLVAVDLYIPSAPQTNVVKGALTQYLENRQRLNQEDGVIKDPRQVVQEIEDYRKGDNYKTAEYISSSLYNRILSYFVEFSPKKQWMVAEIVRYVGDPKGVKPLDYFESLAKEEIENAGR